MKRRVTFARVVLIAALLSAAAAGTSSAQEPASAGVAAPAPAPPPPDTDKGPRLPLDWRTLHVQQPLEVTSSYRAAHKIVLSTLTLVVIVVLIVLLIA